MKFPSGSFPLYVADEMFKSQSRTTYDVSKNKPLLRPLQMFEKCDRTKYLINIPKHSYQSSNMRGKICLDFFFSSCNHKFPF